MFTNVVRKETNAILGSFTVCVITNVADMVAQRCQRALRSSSSLAKGYDPLYSSSPSASLDGFSRSHGDSKCNAASGSSNQSERALQRTNKDIFSVYNSRYGFALIVCQ